jgi:membrane protease YdiL (CAAX protease family)
VTDDHPDGGLAPRGVPGPAGESAREGAASTPDRAGRGGDGDPETGRGLVSAPDAGLTPAPPRLWPGLVAWGAIALAQVGLEVAGVVDGLAIPVPLVLALVVARAMDLRPPGRRLARALRLLAIVLALAALGAGWWFRRAAPVFLTPEALAALGSGAVLLLLLAVPALRVRLVRALRLDPASSVHAVVAAAVVMTLVVSLVLHGQLEDEADEDLPFDVTDPLVSVLSDGVLALAGVGFLLSRNARSVLTRLDLGPLRLRHVLAAVGLAVVFHLAVALMEHAESVWLPDLHAREDRFGYEFVGVPPVVGAVLVSLAAGVGEEVVFRGALQPRLGIVLTSLVFAALHVQYQVPGMVMIFVVGIGLGLLKQRTSTSFTACVHVLYDVGAFLLPEV